MPHLKPMDVPARSVQKQSGNYLDWKNNINKNMQLTSEAECARFLSKTTTYIICLRLSKIRKGFFTGISLSRRWVPSLWIVWMPTTWWFASSNLCHVTTNWYHLFGSLLASQPPWLTPGFPVVPFLLVFRRVKVFIDGFRLVFANNQLYVCLVPLGLFFLVLFSFLFLKDLGDGSIEYWGQPTSQRYFGVILCGSM